MTTPSDLLEHHDAKPVRPAKLWEALIPVVALMLMIFFNVAAWHKEELKPAAQQIPAAGQQIPLLMGAAVAALVGLRMGHKWKAIEEGLLEGIAISLQAIMILLVIGMLIATWIASGIVPIMIYYGLQLLNPSIFLAATCVICCIVSVSTGSSWTTAGTVGVALIGIGKGLGMPLPMVAGAIISGSYFGDKLSPLSDTTNLAPAVAGSELFQHVRYMMFTTIPALIIALILYALIGHGGGTGSAAGIAEIRSVISQHFNLNPILLLPPLLVIGMVVFKLPALPALLGGVILGAVLAMTIQGTSLLEIVSAAHNGFKATTGNASVDDLLSRGGLTSMLETIALILSALSFGGIMERTGMLATLAGSVLKFARNTGSLVATTVFTCFGMNILAPDQYLSIIVPGRMYREAYQKAGLEPRLLSRTLEDAGTLSSALVPWNTCGAYMTTTLGASAMAYAPYAFINLLCPIIAIIIASFGWGIVKVRSETNATLPTALR